MAFAGIKFWAIVAAAVAAFLFGALWYGALGKAWMAAANIDPGVRKTPRLLPFVIAFAALLVMAWVLAGIMGHLGPGGVTVTNGLMSGAFVWVGFVATSMVVNHAFQGAKPALTLIDSGHWLGVLLIEGAVIGFIGV